MNKNNILIRLTSLTVASAISFHVAASQPIGYATLNGGTTGGNGGLTVYASTGGQIQQALCNRASADTPITIYVEGTINHSNTYTATGNCYSSDNSILLRGVSNVSIIGTGDGALFDELGINVRESSNIVLQNLHVRNVKKTGGKLSNGGDAIQLETNTSNVWVDHCTLEASGGESEGYDSLLDMKAGVKYVTASYNIFRDSGRASLIGSSTADTDNDGITFHNNWFDNIDSRAPLIRYGTAHIFNNFYSQISRNGINARLGANVNIEYNYFENTLDALGTFYSNDYGYWDVLSNQFAGTTQWSNDADAYHPAGPDLVSTGTVTPSYAYRRSHGNDVPVITRATAGANRGLHINDYANCDKYTPVPTSPPIPLPCIASTTEQIPSCGVPDYTYIPPEYRCDRPGAIVQIADPGFCSVDGNIESEHSGFIGSGYANTDNEIGAAIEWSVVASRSGFYTAELHYANGSSQNRGGNYMVNNSSFYVDLPSTNAWDSYRYSVETRIFLTEGENQIRLEADTSQGLPNIDQLTVHGASSVKGTCGREKKSGTNVQIKVNEPGFCGVNGNVESEHAGFLGEGYANTTNAQGAAITWSVNASQSGAYTALIRYANSSTEDRDGELVINGQRTYIDFPSTESWTTYSTSEFTAITLQKGENTIALEAVIDEGLPNIDTITIFGAPIEAGSCD